MICYHGTTKERAEKIMADGFMPDCWFARHIEDAYKFGGNYIIEVDFEPRKIPRGWQFHVLESISPTDIVGIMRIEEP